VDPSLTGIHQVISAPGTPKAPRGTPGWSRSHLRVPPSSRNTWS